MRRVRIEVHPSSAFIGFAAAGVLVLVLSAGPAFVDLVRVAVVAPVQLEEHRESLFEIQEGSPFVVPVGKALAITALGRRQVGTIGVFLLVDGSPVLGVPGTGAPASLIAVPPGPLIPSGSTVEPVGGATSELDSRAWGYLVDA